MIRIEGIPLVSARLAGAPKPARMEKTPSPRLKIIAYRKAIVAFRAALQNRAKAA